MVVFITMVCAFFIAWSRLASGVGLFLLGVGIAILSFGCALHRLHQHTGDFMAAPDLMNCIPRRSFGWLFHVYGREHLLLGQLVDCTTVSRL